MESKNAVFTAALRLPPDDRAELLQEFLHSLDSEGEVSEAEAEEAWAKELERRVRELDSGAVKGVPAEEAMRQIREAGAGTRAKET